MNEICDAKELEQSTELEKLENNLGEIVRRMDELERHQSDLLTRLRGSVPSPADETKSTAQKSEALLPALLDKADSIKSLLAQVTKQQIELEHLL